MKEICAFIFYIQMVHLFFIIAYPEKAKGGSHFRKVYAKFSTLSLFGS